MLGSSHWHPCQDPRTSRERSEEEEEVKDFNSLTGPSSRSKDVNYNIIKKHWWEPLTAENINLTLEKSARTSANTQAFFFFWFTWEN